jgi:uncharacterized membrane protein YgaE (UPF0421/DUF939 family)
MTNILSVIAAPRRTTRQSMLAAVFFALELAAAAGLLSLGYSLAGKPGATWAMISAVLVLYPGINQSLSAALIRIAANLLGGLVGYLIGYYLGTDMMQVVLALIILIFIGELLHLDLALRTACVAAIIVLSAHTTSIALSAIERMVAVISGCSAALIVQILERPFQHHLWFVAQTENSPGNKANQASQASSAAAA